MSGPTREPDVDLDGATWLRGAGRALWKALILMVECRGTAPERHAEASRGPVEVRTVESAG